MGIDSNAFKTGHSEAFDRYLKNITPHVGDRTYSVLKAHLMLEELLNEYVSSQLKHPAALKGARLSFAQVLALATSLHPFFKLDNWNWEALRRLNSLRNKMAHSPIVEDVLQRSDELAQYVIQNAGVPLPLPLPESAAGGSGDPAGAYPGGIPRFAAIDIALAGLYTGLRANFEVVSKVTV